MKKTVFFKYRLFFLLLGLGIIFLFGYFSIQQPLEQHLAIIPHFMLASEKVDEFYAFLKDQRYADHDPDTIILIAPNHFNIHSSTPQTLCETSEVYFRNQSYLLSPFPRVACDEHIFFPFGNAVTTKEHGIGEHLVWIKKYFPDTKSIIPVVLPTHREPSFCHSEGNEKSSECGLRTGRPSRSEGQLFIASVDFSHYLPEATARFNDQISIQTLQNGTGIRSDFRILDVDCPACLFSIQQIANQKHQQAQLYYRDSSSTILGRDMKEENTSRVFMWYE